MTRPSVQPEPARRLHNLCWLGTVAELAFDAPGPRARVQDGDLLSAWLPVLAPRCGENATVSPLTVGEQVAVLCPEGDPARGLIIGSIPQAAHPAPALGPDIHRTRYRDGAVIDYDTAAHAATLTLPGGGTVTLNAPAEVRVTSPQIRLEGHVTITNGLSVTTGAGATATITGTMQLNGNLQATGSLESAGDQIAGGISQIGHVHTGVQPGGGLTGTPQ